MLIVGSCALVYLVVAYSLAYLAYLDMRYVRRWNCDWGAWNLFQECGRWAVYDRLMMPVRLVALVLLYPPFMIWLWSTNGQK